MQLCCSAHSSMTFRSTSQHKQWINCVLKKRKEVEGFEGPQAHLLHKKKKPMNFWTASQNPAWPKGVLSVQQMSVPIGLDILPQPGRRRKGSTRSGKSILLQSIPAGKEGTGVGAVGQIESRKREQWGSSSWISLLLSAIKKRDCNQCFMNHFLPAPNLLKLNVHGHILLKSIKLRKITDLVTVLKEFLFWENENVLKSEIGKTYAKML